MIEIAVCDSSGQEVDQLELDEQLLGGQIHAGLLKQAYVRYHANRRQGSATTRNRGRVEGSTRKLYRQKGSGNARRGARRTNIMRGGGVTFAKQPKSWRLGMPKKMRRLANRNAILAKAVDGEIKLVDQFSFESPSTRQFEALLAALKIDRSCLLVLDQTVCHEALSARNIPSIHIMRTDQLNVFEVLNHRYLLLAKPSLSRWLQRIGPERSEAV